MRSARIALVLAFVSLLAVVHVHALPLIPKAPLARRQLAAATVTVSSLTSSSSALVQSTADAATGTVSAAATATATATADAAETTNSADESDGESALTPDQLNQINSNSLNAIYVMVALVAIMAGCVFVSSNSSEEIEDGISEVSLEKHIQDSPGGKPSYNKDGTLKSIEQIFWEVHQTVNGIAEGNEMEQSFLEEGRKSQMEAMNRYSSR
ncbi:hypothetical protein HDU83_006720 [Entophlyctis luteolus]|nr:hypothetical protein HDU83_006720 [Entophlyctis luteolus]